MVRVSSLSFLSFSHKTKSLRGRKLTASILLHITYPTLELYVRSPLPLSFNRLDRRSNEDIHQCSPHVLLSGRSFSGVALSGWEPTVRTTRIFNVIDVRVVLPTVTFNVRRFPNNVERVININACSSTSTSSSSRSKPFVPTICFVRRIRGDPLRFNSLG